MIVVADVFSDIGSAIGNLLGERDALWAVTTPVIPIPARVRDLVAEGVSLEQPGVPVHVDVAGVGGRA